MLKETCLDHLASLRAVGSKYNDHNIRWACVLCKPEPPALQRSRGWLMRGGMIRSWVVSPVHPWREAACKRKSRAWLHPGKFHSLLRMYFYLSGLRFIKEEADFPLSFLDLVCVCEILGCKNLCCEVTEEICK